MKRLIFLLLCTFSLSALLTQLIIYISYKQKLLMIPGGAFSMLSFVAVFSLVTIVLLLRERTPKPSYRRLSKILRSEGYSDSFYEQLGEWAKKCEKKGHKDYSSLTLAELLIDGGRFSEAFETLAEIDFNKLSRTNKQIYFNAYLYGAVLCSDRESADRIYESGRPLLITVTNRRLSASIKHTLGCYEYMRGRLNAAEELFLQSLDNAGSGEVICDDYFALCACYLDTGRLVQARSAVKKASRYVSDPPMRRKLERAKQLVEQAFRDAIKDEQII